MARAKKPRKIETAAHEVPPGATRKALDRPLDPGGGPPGSGAGPRHAAGDPGTEVEEPGAAETNPIDTVEEPEEEDVLEKGPPYAGVSGGAVGGTPAEGRSSGGQTRGGISPGGIHRGDSTIGTDPESGAE
jgi:hypothetical protein